LWFSANFCFFLFSCSIFFNCYLGGTLNSQISWQNFIEMKLILQRRSNHKISIIYIELSFINCPSIIKNSHTHMWITYFFLKMHFYVRLKGIVVLIFSRSLYIDNISCNHCYERRMGNIIFHLCLLKIMKATDIWTNNCINEYLKQETTTKPHADKKWDTPPCYQGGQLQLQIGNCIWMILNKV
jgi:hypothetical protein